MGWIQRRRKSLPGTSLELAPSTGSDKLSPQAAWHQSPAVRHFFDTAQEPQAASSAERCPAVQIGPDAEARVAVGIPASSQPCKLDSHPLPESFDSYAANDAYHTTSSAPSTPTTPLGLVAAHPRPPLTSSQMSCRPPWSQGSSPGSEVAVADWAPPPFPHPPRSAATELLDKLSTTLVCTLANSRLGSLGLRLVGASAPSASVQLLEPLRALSWVALPVLPETSQQLEAAKSAGLGSQDGAAGNAVFGQHHCSMSVRPVPATELAENKRPSRRANSSVGSQPDSSPRAQHRRSALEDWQIRPDQLEFLTRPNGTPWQLGCGAFGCVEKARLNGVEFVAIKALKCYSATDTLRDTRARANFEREVEILSSCRHRNVVSFLGTGTGRGGELLLVTEFCEGGDLFRALAQDGDEKLCWAGRGRGIALDIARGLVYLHARGIVHLDLKSPNVLLDGHGVAKIADVGLAKLLSGTAVTATAAGTFAWASPEQLFGQRCDEKADIWSFGVILWEFATGEAPTSRSMRPIRVPEECPAEIDALIKRCTDPDPALRPTAKQAFDVIAALQ